MDSTVIFTIIGGLTALIVGAASTFFSRREHLEIQKLDELVKVTAAKTEEAQAQVVRAITEKLPEGASAPEIQEALKTQLQFGGDIIVNQITRESSDLIESLVKGYHQQALSQAKVQFWFSVIAATVGFGYILWAASSVATGEGTSSLASSTLKILPGVVIDVVAALFFRQAEQTRQRATELYDRLRTDSQMGMAQKLLTTIDDVRVRSVAQAQIALHMAGLKPREIDVAALMLPSKVRMGPQRSGKSVDPIAD